MNLIYLFANFCRIGFFAVGGGLATLPFLFEIADNANWLSRESIGNMLAIAQSAPGAIGVNLASYVGFTYTGPAGGYVAALGLITPSIIIIIIVARMLEAFKENRIVKTLFTALRPAAAGLLSAAGFSAIVLAVWNVAAMQWYEYLKWKEGLLLVVIFFLIVKFKKHPILYIAAAGVVGVILKL
jgi:chromate transporter